MCTRGRGKAEGHGKRCSWLCSLGTGDVKCVDDANTGSVEEEEEEEEEGGRRWKRREKKEKGIGRTVTRTGWE
jgi:hypothetical protein